MPTLSPASSFTATENSTARLYSSPAVAPTQIRLFILGARWNSALKPLMK